MLFLSFGFLAYCSCRWVSTLVRSQRRFGSLDSRLPLPECCERLFRGCRNDKVWIASPADRFRCPKGFVDMLSEQKPCRGIGRSRKKFLSDSCRVIGEHICRIRVLAESLSVMRKLFFQCTLANPFDVTKKIFWSKSTSELKLSTVIFSHNLLNLLVLQQFSKILTVQ